MTIEQITTRIQGLQVNAVYVGRAADKQADGEKWEHFLWTVTVRTPRHSFSLPYKCGLAHVEKNPAWKNPYLRHTPAAAQWDAQNSKPKAPSANDVMHSLVLDADALQTSFEYWCEEYGYDSDSIRALNTYRACCDIGKDMQKAFTRDEINTIREHLQDY